MKTYQSHKTVEAARIVELFEERNHSSGAINAQLKLEDGTFHVVTPEWYHKHSDHGRTNLVGGYYVRYTDGYTSWSPAKAFEEGYSAHSLDPKDGALPVAGYKPQTEEKVTLVNSFKHDEERILRKLDAMKDQGPAFEQRWLATGRTQLEKAFMSINRAVFQPGRVKLPEDPQ